MKFVIQTTISHKETGEVLDTVFINVTCKPKDACRTAREKALKLWKEAGNTEPCVVDTPMIGIVRPRDRN